MPASDRRPPRRELALQAQIAQAVARRGTQLASVLGAIVVLMHRRLSGSLHNPDYTALKLYYHCELHMMHAKIDCASTRIMPETVLWQQVMSHLCPLSTR